MSFLLFLTVALVLLWLLRDPEARQSLWEAVEVLLHQPLDSQEDICIPPANFPLEDLPPGTGPSCPLESRIPSGGISAGQQACWAALEQLTGHEFLCNYRPQFMANPESGRPLELDCYSPQLQVALEYNGRQHVEYVPRFHRSPADFIASRRRDAYKQLLCNQHRIFLIVVPHTVRLNQINNFIKQQLAKRYRLN